jgi:hypothetical protein
VIFLGEGGDPIKVKFWLKFENGKKLRYVECKL